MSVSVRPLTGAQIGERLGDLARLRIAVFADYPYLYDGDEDYEARYLSAFAAAPDAAMIAAFDGDAIVGAATASPMAAQEPEVRRTFEDRGIDTARLFYFGESVLLGTYRGQGIGHAFFDHREDAARKGGANAATFASVVRPQSHPARPESYRPLDAFWRKRGYAAVEGFTTELAWKEHGEDSESVKRMQFWMKPL